MFFHIQYSSLSKIIIIIFPVDFLPEDGHANSNTVVETQTGVEPCIGVGNQTAGAENRKLSAIKESSLKSILKASPVPQRSAMATGELQIRQVDEMNMMVQLTQKLGKVVLQLTVG